MRKTKEKKITYSCEQGEHLLYLLHSDTLKVLIDLLLDLLFFDFSNKINMRRIKKKRNSTNETYIIFHKNKFRNFNYVEKFKGN